MAFHNSPHYIVLETPELRERLEELHDLDRGILVCEMTSGHRRVEQLANDLLVALGKDLSKRQGARNQYDRWQRTVAWVAAYEPRDIVILRADRVGWTAWRDLVDLANFAEARLWLVMRSTTYKRSDREWLTRWRVSETLEGEALLMALAPKRTPPKKDVTPRAFPRVPESSFVFFERWLTAASQRRIFARSTRPGRTQSRRRGTGSTLSQLQTNWP